MHDSVVLYLNYSVMRFETLKLYVVFSLFLQKYVSELSVVRDCVAECKEKGKCKDYVVKAVYELIIIILINHHACI